MNAEQKQRAVDLIDVTKTYRLDAEECAMQMAALLQELVDAPAPEPFGYFKSEPFGWTDCAETDDGAIALYTAPSEPKPVARVTGYYAGYLSIATVDGRVLPTGTALYTAPPAPSVLDVELQAAFDRGLKAGNEQKEAQQVEIHRLHDLLAAAPTPAEAPADVARDAEPWKLLLENLVEGLNKTHWSSWQGTAHFDEYLQEAISAIERDKLKGQS